jgi:hypothetical protein
MGRIILMELGKRLPPGETTMQSPAPIQGMVDKILIDLSQD